MTKIRFKKVRERKTERVWRERERERETRAGFCKLARDCKVYRFINKISLINNLY
jgi:hypothetical protein